MKLLILFVVMNIVNVVLQTIKSIATVKCGKWGAAIVNAVAYGLYTFVIYYTTADGMSLWAKAGITAVANFFGVYITNFLFKKLFDKTLPKKCERF